MKETASYHYIYTLCLAGTLALLPGACTTEDAQPGIKLENGKGILNLTVSRAGGDDAHDQIRTARFIVFDDASTYPKPDVNQVISLDASQQNARSFRATLKVNQNDDKMIVAIINEQNIHKSALDAATSPADVEKIMYNAGVLGATPADIYGSGATGMPMSGVRRGIAVTKTHTATPAEAGMTIERSVARVEVWLRTEDGVTSGILSGQSPTQVNLKRSAAAGYLAAGTMADGTRFQTGADADRNFGIMFDEDNPATTFTWSCTAAEARSIGTTSQLIAAFYIPERLCDAPDNANKLTLDILNVPTPRGMSGVRDVVLDAFAPQETAGAPSEPLTRILRNNIYRVSAVVRAARKLDLSCTVVPWTDKTVGVILDPQYYLRLSNDRLTLTNTEPGNTGTITITTDYDRTDRGFPAGIRMDQNAVSYYDPSGMLVTNTARPMYGWLTWTGGADGDLERDVLFWLQDNNRLDSSCDGCTARVMVKAGNLQKPVSITFRYTEPAPPPTPEEIVASFARSNIILTNDGRLTFAVSKADNGSPNKIYANYMGMQFKWGSLIGIPPMGTPGKSSGNYPPGAKLFIPAEYTGSARNWQDIPRFVPQTTVDSKRTDAFIAAYPNTGYDARTGVGDICRYISDKGWVKGRWRLPNIAEIEALFGVGHIGGTTGAEENNPSFGIAVAGGRQVRYAAGVFGMKVGTNPNVTSAFLINPDANKHVFPHTGYRDGAGRMTATNQAWSWSSSPAGEWAYGMGFTGTDVNRTAFTGKDPEMAFSVRCVRDE